jgi:hypothetical protein
MLPKKSNAPKKTDTLETIQKTHPPHEDDEFQKVIPNHDKSLISQMLDFPPRNDFDEEKNQRKHELEKKFPGLAIANKPVPSLPVRAPASPERDNRRDHRDDRDDRHREDRRRDDRDDRHRDRDRDHRHRDDRDDRRHDRDDRRRDDRDRDRDDRRDRERYHSTPQIFPDIIETPPTKIPSWEKFTMEKYRE